jgi:tetratricopeptide (TPR) repeat protein
MSKYNRKQRTKPDDEFVGFWQKFFNAIEPYARAIGVSALSALVIVFAVWGISTWRDHKKEDAAEAFSRAVKIYDADLITDDNPVKSDEENPTPRFKTDKERVDATIAELDALDKKFGGEVSRDALLFRAGIYYDQGRFDEAASAYTRFLDGQHQPSVTAVAREGLGLCHEARGKLDDALTAYQALEPKSGDYFRDRALYDQARVYLKKGDKKKASDLYKEVLAKVPTTPLRDEIQTQLALLEPS